MSNTTPTRPVSPEIKIDNQGLRGRGRTVAPLGEAEERAPLDLDEEQEVEEVPKVPDQWQPSEAEMEDHRCDHCPYRSWCKWCVMGRGRGQQHNAAKSESSVPLVGIDYFFITKGGVRSREEVTNPGGTSSEPQEEPPDPGGEEPGEDYSDVEAARSQGMLIKCLVVRCQKTKSVFAHCIPRKGADEEGYAAGLAAKDIQWLGHTRVIIKADNEPALLALVQEARF